MRPVMRRIPAVLTYRLLLADDEGNSCQPPVKEEDVYAADHSRFRRWLAGEKLDPQEEAEWWRPWPEMMRRHREARRTLRRLRVISEPVTEYIKF